MRIEPAGLAVLVGHCVAFDDALPRADGADPADAALAVADRMLLDNEPLLAILAITILGARSRNFGSIYLAQRSSGSRI